MAGERKRPEASQDVLAAGVGDLREAYVLYSPLTNMSYIECEEVDYNDQVRLYAGKADAQAAVKELEAEGIRAEIRELRIVEAEVSSEEKRSKGAGKKQYLNQVRQYLITLPYIGVNAVCYKPVKETAQTIELARILPNGYERKVRENALCQPNLQLTGLYLMQEARRKKEDIDQKRLQEMDEEFSSNLVRAKLLLAVLPPEAQEERRFDLKECRFPYLRRQNGDCFFPVFTDFWEYQKYAQSKQNLRPIQISFSEIGKFWVEDAKAYVLNPMGFSIPITREMIPRVLERFGVEA